ncbi:MAG: 4'-phosphopantetheinyl transferase superfamily protein [Synergistaceae bacterium]|nr:4'-phosphopantetheinyl transferase superfamily protein [Synergistaceae bacterium]
MIRLTLLDIRGLRPKAEELLRGLPEELRKKALRYRKEDDQLRSIGSSFLLLKAAKGQEIHYSLEGKPFVDGEKYFSISHSGDYVVLAEADSPIGVDVERVADIGINDDLKNVALTEREKLWVKDSLLRFYVVWTRKESLIKCEGHGFISEPCEIDALPENDFDDLVKYEGKFYRIESFMFDGHIISLAIETVQ